MDKYKQLFSNTLIFTVGTFGSKLLTFLMGMVYLGILPRAGAGMMDIVTITASFLIPVATMGITESITRFGLDKDYDNTRVFTNGVVTTLLGMTALALLFPLINLIHLFDGYGFYLYMYVYISSFKALCSQFVRARGLVKLYAFDGILTSLTLVLSNILLMVVFKMGVHGYVLSIILSDGLSVLFLTLTAKLTKYIRPDRIDRSLWKTMLKYSIPLIPTTVLWLVISGSDRFIINGLMGLDYSGLYRSANQLPTIIATLSMFFTQAWHMSAITEKDSGSYERFYGNVFSSYQSLMYIATAGMLLLNRPLFALITIFDSGKQYQEGYLYVPWLLLGTLFMCLGSYLSSAYAVKKRSVNSFVTSLIAAAVNIGFNFLLIPKWGIQGASFATMLSYAACFFVRLIDTRRYVHFPVSFGKVLIHVLLLTGMAVLALTEPPYLYWYQTALCLIVILLNFKAVVRTAFKLLPDRFKKKAHL